MNTPNTRLQLQDTLPLTCSRTGTCCFGKQVRLNPWELATLAATKEISPSEFSDRYCEIGGTRLKFDGSLSASGEKACSQYIHHFGCSLHSGRPLVCRLYPIGRQKQNGEVTFIYEGSEFPCMKGCPEVTALPYLTVEAYLQGQQTEQFELAQDMYLDLMQSIADIAFALLLETGLAEADNGSTLSAWQQMGQAAPETLANDLDNTWKQHLMMPAIAYTPLPDQYIEQHALYIQTIVQQEIEQQQTLDDFHQLSVNIMRMALLLGFALGADPHALAEHWIEIAKANL